MAEFPYRGDLPFAAIERTNQVKDPLTNSWPIDLPVPLAEIRNIKVADGLSMRQRDMLAQQGFLIIRSHEPQFSEIQKHVSWAYGQPYLLTADAASHALKVSLDQLLKALEREELHRRLRMLTETTLRQVESYFPLLAGSELEDDARLAAAYLGVGLRLLDPAASLDPELEAMITPQVEQILAGRGLEEATLFPGLSENFQLYRPEGHYLGDSSLEAYFRGKTWLERINFPMGEAGSGSGTEFVPLILTLALRQSTTEMGHSTQEWTRIVETLNFFEGIRYGGGPPETAILMDRAYGAGATILGLQDQPQLDIFRSLVRDLPLPQTDPVLVLEPSGEGREKSWSLLGMHYSIHSLAMQRFAQEIPTDAESTFLLPGGLELMGVLGSDLAMKARLQEGAEARIDPEIVANLSRIILNQPEADWEASMGNLWLDGFRDRLRISEAKHADSVFPGEAAGLWAEKELNSILGSWAAMQSESTEPSFSAEEVGGEEIEEIDPRFPPSPGFVEPEPQYFYTLSRIAFMAAEGLRTRNLTGIFSSRPERHSLNGRLLELLDLADRLQRLGDIALRELNGEPPNEADYALIQAPLGIAEDQRLKSGASAGSAKDPEPPSLAGAAFFDFGGDRILQVATGDLDRIYMLIPLRDGVYIAQGGVYSYYEFSPHRDRQMDDESWRLMLIHSPPDRPAWVEKSLLSDGTAVDVLAYRIGDVYRVLPEAGMLQLRSSPFRDARVVQLAVPGEYLEIVSGPVKANGLEWWEVRLSRDSSETFQGWIVENQDWIERAWK